MFDDQLPPPAPPASEASEADAGAPVAEEAPSAEEVAPEADEGQSQEAAPVADEAPAEEPAAEAPAEEAEHRLRDLKIVNVAYFPQSLNTRYLVSASPFYAALPQRWRILSQVPNTMYMLIPKNP